MTPAEPCNKLVNEYMVCLVVRGVEKGEAIVKHPCQPLMFSEALKVYAKLSRDFIVCAEQESLNALDSLQDFMALML